MAHSQINKEFKKVIIKVLGKEILTLLRSLTSKNRKLRIP